MGKKRHAKKTWKKGLLFLIESEKTTESMCKLVKEVDKSSIIVSALKSHQPLILARLIGCFHTKPEAGGFGFSFQLLLSNNSQNSLCSTIQRYNFSAFKP